MKHDGIVAVKSKTANALGLYDMSVNVSEWCFDLSGGSNRMHRGGNCFSIEQYLMVGYILNRNPSDEPFGYGIRFARTR